jgi:hypothetical protein
MNKKNNDFSEWLGNIPHNNYQNILEQIMDKCYIKRNIISNWKNGITPIPPLAKKEIEKIAGKKIFNNL